MIRDCRGFTLIEAALVLAIIALVVGTTLPLVGVILKQQGEKTTAAHMDAVEEALRFFVTRTSRLPCPALGGNQTEPTGAETGSGPQAVLVPSKCLISQGLIPWRTLGIDPALSLDGYNRPLTYALHTDIAAGKDMCGELPPQGLEVVDENGVSLSPNRPLAVVLVGHGENGDGALLGFETPGRVATITQFELENANDDPRFIARPRLKSELTPFDDMVRWLAVDRIRGDEGSCQNGGTTPTSLGGGPLTPEDPNPAMPIDPGKLNVP